MYSFINLTILDFLHSVEIAFFLFSLFFSFYVCVCASVFLLTSNLILFNAKWLFQAASTLMFTFNIFIVVLFIFEQEGFYRGRMNDEWNFQDERFI